MVDSISSIGMSSEEKKSRIVKYALDTRKQFIKLLVLEAWSHDAPSVTELINIKTWLDSESTVCTRTVELLMLTRKLTSAARYVAESDFGSYEADGMSEFGIRIWKRR